VASVSCRFLDQVNQHPSKGEGLESGRCSGTASSELRPENNRVIRLGYILVGRDCGGHGIAWLDLLPRNIDICSGEGRLKLADFDAGQMLDQPEQTCTRWNG
jgi:hypothetical protein